MYMSVVASVIFGWILLLAVTFALPSTEFGSRPSRVCCRSCPGLWTDSMSQGWAEVLLFICVVAQFFCVTASMTSASRMMFAFSRDRAVPGHPLWRRVATNRVPRWSVFGVGILRRRPHDPRDLANYFIGYAAGTAIAVIGLYIAFIIPVYLRLRLGDAWNEPRAWSLGRHYKWIGIVAIAWVGDHHGAVHHAAVQVGMPWHADFTWEFTNYTILWFAGIGLVFGGWWLLSARKWFEGPVRMGTEEELERLEEEQRGRYELPTEAS